MTHLPASPPAATGWRTPAVVLAAGAAILALSLGIRHGFGLFLAPMSVANGWGRETFSFAISLQNLVWGLSGPFIGLLADRIGAGKVILASTVVYVAGLLGMAASGTGAALAITAGLLVGLGLAGTSFAVVFGAVSRAVPAEKRSMAMGVASAVGSFGQFAMLPTEQFLIGATGWSQALAWLAALAALMAPLAFVLFERRAGPVAGAAPELTAVQALREALSHRGYWLLGLGYFVCGFQILFISMHMTAYLVDHGLPATDGMMVLALIGLFNIAGTFAAGWAGQRWRKPALLSAVYAGRALVIAAFLLVPVSAPSAYAFGAAMGFLWLSTVPLTNGTVATLFGVRNLSMLGALVFLFHQVGAFVGGWLGGLVYDRLGSYDIAWGAAIALSLFAAAVNVPVREKPVARLAAAVRPA